MEKLNTIKKDAFLYGYVDKNIPFPFYIYTGSSSRTPARENLSKEELLEHVDLWHRKNGPAKYMKSTKNGGNYSYTDWRIKLQFNFKEYAENNWEIEFITEPKDMTLEELLTLEGDKIKELQSKGQALLNQDVDPLKSWRKHNS